VKTRLQTHGALPLFFWHHAPRAGATVRDLPQSNGIIIAFCRNLIAHFKHFSSGSSPAPSTPGPRPRARIGLFRIPFSPEPVCPPSCGAKGVALRLFGSPSWVDREGAFLQLSAHAHGVFGICPLMPVATSALPIVDSRPLPPETRKELASARGPNLPES